ncbi:MAG: hypothetical protein HKL96_12800 [Phycisphaerales bacterium]|nr:hypothetical protein [Phycisphaerales bacterium]
MPSFITVSSLLALHAIDRDTVEFQRQLESVLKNQVSLQSRLDEFQRVLGEQEASLKKLKVAEASAMSDIEARNTHINKLRETLNTTRTNKEYTPLLVEISAEKAEVAKLETACEQIMEQQQQLTKAIEATVKQIADLQATLSAMQSQSAHRVEELETKLKALADKRASAAALVPKDAIRQYDRLCQKYPGDALAVVEFAENDMESISCGGCFMNLSIEDVNLLRGRDEVRRCNSCGRILYLLDMAPQAQTA